MRRGLQVGFGELIGAALLADLRARGCQVIRLDAQTSPSLEHTTALVNEVTDAGLQPCTIIRDAAHLSAIPDGQLVEFGNEPDLGAQFGWPDASEYIRLAREAAEVDEGRHQLFLGVVSNLNERGFSFLEAMDWPTIPLYVGCAFHRYPDGDDPQPAVPSRERRFRGPDHRDREVAELRRIVGNRPLALTEVGYHTARSLTEQQQAANMAWERAFWQRHGIDAVAYQINSGPDPREVQHQYGFRRVDGTWRPVATAWFGAAMPPATGPTQEEFDALVLRVESLEARVAALEAEEPPDPEPPTQVCKILVMDPNAQPIEGATVTNGMGAPQVTAADGLVSFEVLGSMLYDFSKDGWTPTTRDLPPWIETHRVHLEPAPAPIPEPPSGSFIEPIRGYLRRGPYATWADDGGPRSIRFCSYFPAWRDWKDRPDEVKRNLDRMMGRWHGWRGFYHLADPWAPFQKDVRPSWSKFDELFVSLLRESWDRGLRVSLTAGDLQFLSKAEYEALVPRIATLCKGVNEQVVPLSGMVNEARVNSWDDVKSDPKYWLDRVRDWQDIYPWGQQSTSDPVDAGGDPEIPSVLRAWAASPATFSLVHGTRKSAIDAIRRAFNVKFEGVPDLMINQDEPTNILNPRMTGHNIRVFQPLSTKQEVFGLYSMIVMTGQLLTFFGDCSLTNTAQLPINDDWGFDELPERWQRMNVPDNIGEYELIPGHKAEAPITIEGIPAEASARCDTMTAPDGSRGYALIYGQTAVDPSRWRIVARQACQGALWEAEGDPKAFTTAGGMFADEPSSKQVIVVEWHR